MYTLPDTAVFTNPMALMKVNGPDTKSTLAYHASKLKCEREVEKSLIYWYVHALCFLITVNCDHSWRFTAKY